MTDNQKIALGITLATGSFFLTYYGYTEITNNRLKQNELYEYNQFLANNKTFYKDTYINDFNVEGLTLEEAISSIENDFNSKEIYISSFLDNKPEKFVFADLNLDFNNFENYITNIFLEQEISQEEYFDNSLIEEKHYSYDFFNDYMEDNVYYENVSFLKPENIIDSVDAYITVDVKHNSVTINDEIIGNRIKEGVFEEKIKHAFESNINEIILTEEDYILPKIYANDESIEREVELYDAIFNKSISLNVCGILDELDKEKTRDFYIFDSDSNVSVNEKKLSDYIYNLKNSYDTYGKPRSFHTSTGKDVVIEKNLYGWEINYNKTFNIVKDALLSINERESISAIYNHTGQRYVLNEISNTYIEVSIDDQHVWMYRDGECILSSVCITGELTNPDSWTHKGVYYLINTATDCVLKGPDYRYDVSYWIFFDRENAIGFHDATWRDPSEFTNTTYNGNGSHGCINLPLDVVASLYNNLTMDEPVIIW